MLTNGKVGAVIVFHFMEILVIIQLVVMTFLITPSDLQSASLEVHCS